MRRRDEPRFLGPGDRSNFCASGTEHLRTEKRLATVFVDNIEKHIPRGGFTRRRNCSPPAGTGWLPAEPGNGQWPHAVEAEQRIRIKDGMRFFSQVPGGGSRVMDRMKSSKVSARLGPVRNSAVRAGKPAVYLPELPVLFRLAPGRHDGLAALSAFARRDM